MSPASFKEQDTAKVKGQEDALIHSGRQKDQTASVTSALGVRGHFRGLSKHKRDEGCTE